MRDTTMTPWDPLAYALGTRDSGLSTMDEAPSLIGRHLVRTFGDGDTQTTAVDDVSLELYRGQFALLMGPSGSGKSTLLAVLSGLLRPTAGQVVAREGDRVLDIWQMSDK